MSCILFWTDAGSDLLADEAGFIISAELVLVATTVVLGLVVGLTCLRDAIVAELTDVGEAIGSLNQSFCYTGMSAHKDFQCGTKSRTAGSFFVDLNDARDASADFAVPCPDQFLPTPAAPAPAAEPSPPLQAPATTPLPIECPPLPVPTPLEASGFRPTILQSPATLQPCPEPNPCHSVLEPPVPPQATPVPAPSAECSQTVSQFSAGAAFNAPVLNGPLVW